MHATPNDQESEPRSLGPFITIFAGQTFSLLGSRLVQFALVWWLTRETGSATVLAFASMMALLPQVLLGPFAGALTDRWSRRVVMIVADGTIALLTLGLAGLYAAGRVEVWHVYVLMALRSTAGTFQWAAMQASTTLLVPKRHLSRVGGLNSTLSGLALIVAPALGALLMEWLPMQGIVAIDVATAIPAIAPLLFIHIPQPKKHSVGAGKETKEGLASVLHDLREGLAFVSGWPALLIAIVMGMVINMLAAPAMSLMPLLVKDYFGGGAMELAQIEAMVGIGMVAGGLTLSVWGGTRRRIVTALGALAIRGFAQVALGMTPASAFLLAVALAFLMNYMSPMVDGILMAVLQATIPPGMQGRVFALVMSGFAAAMPLGLAIAGPVADALGLQVWYLISGCATAAVAAAGFFLPALMHLEDGQPLKQKDPSAARKLTAEG